MLYYHESQNDQITLDKEPLLTKYKYKCNNNTGSASPTTTNDNNNNSLKRVIIPEEECDFEIINDISIYIDEYYINKFELSMNTTSDNSTNISSSSSVIPYNYESEIGQNLLGIFVVSFDTKLGNVIEWQIPDKSVLNLDNVEFKAMASGFHLVQNDFVYFCKNNMYGLAAFESIKIDNSEERNVRMKSVGLIAKSYKFLKKYVVFLKNQVRNQLENPGNYDILISLWNKKKVVNTAEFNERTYEQQLNFVLNENSLINKIFNKRLIMYKQLSSINLVDYCPFTRFALYFGPVIFTLWRYVLLNKRVIFYSVPPISDLCARVFCASQMINTSFEFINKRQHLKPFFYVNVMDIEQLQQQPFYIACTTEKIFESKDHLYDLFVNDCQMCAVLNDSQKNLLKINSADKKRYDIFLKKISNLSLVKSPNIFSRIENSDEDESMFVEFFTEQNDRIFTVLNELNFNSTTTTDKNMKHIYKKGEPIQIQSDHIKKMGLDPSDDRDFLNELIRFYDFNLII